MRKPKVSLGFVAVGANCPLPPFLGVVLFSFLVGTSTRFTLLSLLGENSGPPFYWTCTDNFFFSTAGWLSARVVVLLNGFFRWDLTLIGPFFSFLVGVGEPFWVYGQFGYRRALVFFCTRRFFLFFFFLFFLEGWFVWIFWRFFWLRPLPAGSNPVQSFWMFLICLFFLTESFEILFSIFLVTCTRFLAAFVFCFLPNGIRNLGVDAVSSDCLISSTMLCFPVCWEAVRLVGIAPLFGSAPRHSFFFFHRSSFLPFFLCKWRWLVSLFFFSLGPLSPLGIDWSPPLLLPTFLQLWWWVGFPQEPSSFPRICFDPCFFSFFPWERGRQPPFLDPRWLMPCTTCLDFDAWMFFLLGHVVSLCLSGDGMPFWFFLPCCCWPLSITLESRSFFFGWFCLFGSFFFFLTPFEVESRFGVSAPSALLFACGSCLLSLAAFFSLFFG